MSAQSLRSLYSLFWYAVVHFMFGMAGLMGLGALLGGVNILRTGQEGIGVALLVMAMGLLFIAIGFGFFYVVYFAGPAAEARRKLIEARHPDQPWMLRADWAARRMTDRSSLAVTIFMWVWCTGWWGAIAFIWSVNRDKIIAAVEQSWVDAAMGSVFVAGGIIGLVVAVNATVTWWRYGHSTLRIDTLPGYLGESFRGSLSAKFPKRPLKPLELTVVCSEVKMLTRRNAKGQRETERTTNDIWEETHEIDPRRLMWNGTTMTMAIDVPLPASQPGCALDDIGDGIEWVIRVRSTDDTKTGYSSLFQIPVYRRG